ncbi:hypothetical protein FT663_05380 [Candidozyma haemuli var. vulneris]|uniref:Mitochondrial outer membrane protein OM14 C-terminal domain-containing protein n=1 Tax=Candidozyma haemuli TaxID=45357 RepID=A0A2V1AMF1_9ASCO|nr:hypothetical protein CXQ85_001555 [[Candida] haemuloni]KAF3985227.1 hypothetical protein FT663_05380 [[Candida] haemuloni var. vulneris]KAF3992779.1 hypothetical protein FT662_00988 [[Candida] haemuloni var. vulneris]PVH19250.1 hypothetical protein CXQ85_001555 [[Candida] haemuloni]
MSYAEAAAANGPTGSKVVEDPMHSTPEDVKNEAAEGAEKVKKEASKASKDASKEADKLKKDASKATDEAIKKGKATADNVKKDLKELEKESKPYIDSVTKFVKEKYQAASNFVTSYVNKDTVSAAGAEFQNPVVLGQLAVILGGATAGWFVYSERARIRSDNKYVVGIHAALITGLVVADGFIFSQLYPKYKKN